MGDIQIFLWGVAKKIRGGGGVKMCPAILSLINKEVNFCVFDFYVNLPRRNIIINFIDTLLSAHWNFDRDRGCNYFGGVNNFFGWGGNNFWRVRIPPPRKSAPDCITYINIVLVYRLCTSTMHKKFPSKLFRFVSIYRKWNVPMSTL
jgi:hypothetical protein